jgi:hypothetical protein
VAELLIQAQLGVRLELEAPVDEVEPPPNRGLMLAG